MGGLSAPDSLEEGPKTQVWLATSDEPEALRTEKVIITRNENTLLQPRTQLFKNDFLKNAPACLGLISHVDFDY